MSECTHGQSDHCMRCRLAAGVLFHWAATVVLAILDATEGGES